MTNIKSQKRNSLTDQHFEDLLRAAVTQYHPAIKQIIFCWLHSEPVISLTVIHVHNIAETHSTDYKYTTKSCPYSVSQKSPPPEIL